MESYEEYLGNISPSPQFLPVTVTIQIPEKDIEIRNIRIDRTTTITEVKQIVRDYMERTGDPLSEFTNSNVFVLHPSFSSSNEKKRRRKEGILIPDETVPILQYNPEPGALLVMKGILLCKSDEPKKCFKETYEAGAKMDYFTCADCKINWVCRPCMEECHIGHETKEYILDHSATWACCYCVKNRKCKIYGH